MESRLSYKRQITAANDEGEGPVLSKKSKRQQQQQVEVPRLGAGSSARGQSSSGVQSSSGTTITAPLQPPEQDHTNGLPRQMDVPHSQVNYTVGSFVLVRVENDKRASSPAQFFWVAKVLDVVSNTEETFARKLKVHWYDVSGKGSNHLDRRLCQFQPCYSPRSSSKRRKTVKNKKPTRADLSQPWTDIIDTDAVLVNFPSLTRRNTLPLNAQKQVPH